MLCLPVLRFWDHTFPVCAKQILGHYRFSSNKTSEAYAKRLDESGSVSKQDSNTFPLNGMCVVQPSKTCSDNSVAMLVGSHHKVSSQRILYIGGILNKGEQTGVAVLERCSYLCPLTLWSCKTSSVCFPSARTKITEQII